MWKQYSPMVLRKGMHRIFFGKGQLYPSGKVVAKWLRLHPTEWTAAAEVFSGERDVYFLSLEKALCPTPWDSLSLCLLFCQCRFKQPHVGARPKAAAKATTESQVPHGPYPPLPLCSSIPSPPLPLICCQHCCSFQWWDQALASANIALANKWTNKPTTFNRH